MEMNHDHMNTNQQHHHTTPQFTYQVNHDQIEVNHNNVHMHNNMNMEMSGMKMYFHGGYNEVILFDFWRIDSVGGLIGSMFAIFFMALAYEGLRFYREIVVRKHFRRIEVVERRIAPQNADQQNDYEAVSEDQEAPPRPLIRTMETKMWSKGHFLLTLLQFVQITLAYILMLIFMTFNVWLCLATVLGATVGYFLFGWRKTLILQDADHCH